MRQFPGILLFGLFLIGLFQFSTAQSETPPATAGPIPANYQILLAPKPALREQDSLNELVLDLCRPYLTDSVFKRKKQRHKASGLGTIGSPLARIYWEALYNRKEKFVGTAMNTLRIPGKELFTEYDVNWNLTPHLRHYIDLAFYGYSEQKLRNRFPKQYNNYTGPPFEYPEPGQELNPYHLHCENTPPKPYRDAISEVLYPCFRDHEKPFHDYFGEKLPSVGLYGVFCLDCNHSCHPEIHPYEWIWWLNLNPEADQRPNEKIWYATLVREGSNRMKKWSPDPRTGKMTIPLIFPADKTLAVNIDHLIKSEFDSEGFAELKDVPAHAQTFDKTKYQIKVPIKGKQMATIRLSSKKMDTDALKFAFSNFTYDIDQNLLSGDLEIWTSVEWIYAMRVTTNY